MGKAARPSVGAAVVIDEEMVHAEGQVERQPLVEVVGLVLDDGHHGHAHRRALEQRAAAAHVGRLGAQHLAGRPLPASAVACGLRRATEGAGAEHAV